MSIDASLSEEDSHESETALRDILEKVLEAGHQMGLDDQFRKVAGITLIEAATNGDGTYTTILLQQLSVYCFAFLLDSLFAAPQTRQS